MGKNGVLLRVAKKQSTVYTFTREQLEARDRAVEQAYKERFDERLRAAFKAEEERVNAEIAKEWKRREEIFGKGGTDGMYNLLALTIAVPIMVLIDEFGWKPLPPEHKRLHPRSRLARFVICCEDILNDISSDENKDIRAYCEAAWQRSGVKLSTQEAQT